MSKISGFNKTDGIKDVTLTSNGNANALDVNVISGGGGGSDTTAANQLTQIAELQAIVTELQLKANTTDKQSTGDLHSLVPLEHDQVTITAKTVDGPTVIEYRQATALVATLTLTYDLDGDVSNVART